MIYNYLMAIEKNCESEDKRTYKKKILILCIDIATMQIF